MNTRKSKTGEVAGGELMVDARKDQRSGEDEQQRSEGEENKPDANHQRPEIEGRKKDEPEKTSQRKSLQERCEEVITKFESD